MPSRDIKITNKLGLHARAAAKLVKEASTFESEININYADKEVSGKSIMGVMMLAAAQGATIKIVANGKDQDIALDALETLIMEKFGEDN